MNSIIGIADLVRQEVGVAIVPLLKNFDWHKAPNLQVLPLPGDLAVRRIGMLEQGTKSLINGQIRKLLMAAVAKELSAGVWLPTPAIPCSEWRGLQWAA